MVQKLRRKPGFEILQQIDGFHTIKNLRRKAVTGYAKNVRSSFRVQQNLEQIVRFFLS